MKNFVKNFTLLSLLVVMSNCQKTELLKTEGEFIEARIGNELIRYESTNGNPFNNTYYNDSIGNHRQDQLNMLRQSTDGKKSLEIYILGADLDSTSAPIDLSHTSTCSVELQWRNYDADVAVTFGEEDDYNYSGQVQLTLENWEEDNFLSGKFSGQIATRTGKRLNVSEGKFRIQIFD